MSGNGPKPSIPLTAATPPAVQLREVTVRYRGATAAALEQVTLSIPAGSHIAVVGPNGAGKTTLFNTILGLVRPVRGDVLLFGHPPRSRRVVVGYIPQRDQVDWHFPLTAFDIALMGRIRHSMWRVRPGPADLEAAAAALRRVDMWAHRETPIGELSGGEQQRLIIARALAQDAPILLLDEPFNEVDAATQALLLDLFAELARAGRTLLVATHDLHLARTRFPTVLFLNKRLIGYGPVDQTFTEEILQRTYMKQVVKWEGQGGERTVVDTHTFSHKH